MKVDWGQSFTCGMCGGEFVASTTHEESQQQYEQTFAVEAALDMEKGSVCGPCYDEFMDWWQEQMVRESPPRLPGTGP